MVELLQKKRKALRVGLGGRGWLVWLDLAWLAGCLAWLGTSVQSESPTHQKSGLFEDHTHSWSG